MKTFNFRKPNVAELENGTVSDFYLDKKEVEPIQAMSYKKAVKSFQARNPELKIVGVYHPNKKGETLLTWQKLPMGRKKKVGR